MKFITPLTIRGSFSQLEDIVKELINIGYTQEVVNNKEDKALMTNVSGVSNNIAYLTYGSPFVVAYNRTTVDASNKELVLALASMTDNRIGIKGEWWLFEGPSIPAQFIKDKIYKQNDDSIEAWKSLIDENGDRNATNRGYFRKATKEEILNHFGQSTDNKKDMGKKIIGYKVPYDISVTSNPWKNGEIAHRNEVNAKFMGNYKVEGLRGVLPPEIVEKWEPVYEEEKVKLIKGNKNIEVTIENGKIYADGREFSLEKLRGIGRKMYYGDTQTIADLPITWPMVKIGCSTFTFEEVDSIIQTADKQLNR